MQPPPKFLAGGGLESGLSAQPELARDARQLLARHFSAGSIVRM
jgi:hypothetical protein